MSWYSYSREDPPFPSSSLLIPPRDTIIPPLKTWKKWCGSFFLTTLNSPDELQLAHFGKWFKVDKSQQWGIKYASCLISRFLYRYDADIFLWDIFRVSVSGKPLMSFFQFYQLNQRMDKLFFTNKFCCLMLYKHKYNSTGSMNFPTCTGIPPSSSSVVAASAAAVLFPLLRNTFLAKSILCGFHHL